MTEMLFPSFADNNSSGFWFIMLFLSLATDVVERRGCVAQPLDLVRISERLSSFEHETFSKQ